ncbi:MAG: glycosyltransferase [Mucilaginibacter sp.]
MLYAYWNNWGDDFTNHLLPNKKWKAILVGGHPFKSPAVYFISRMIFALAKLKVMFGPVLFYSELAIARASFFLIREAKKHKADIYIGHNLGALAATIKVAKKYHAKCGFDIEDYHRNETDNSTSSPKYKLTKYLENKYLVKADYVTASSPKITEAYAELYPAKHPVTLLNVFPKSPVNITRTANLTGPVKIIWFSQTIGTNRGIEDVLIALKILDNNNLHLHLLGNADDAVKTEFAQLAGPAANNLYFHEPMPPDEIVGFITQFDIGLASEPGFSINNELALSNKIFTYMQAGLAIIASDTQAQQSFIQANPDIGTVYPKKDSGKLAEILTHYNLNRDELFKACVASLNCGLEKYNWENESVKFLNLINQTLKVE